VKPWKLIFLFVWCAVLRCVASIALLPYVDGYYLDVCAQVFQYAILLILCRAAFGLDRTCIRSIVGRFKAKDMLAAAGLAIVLAALTWKPGAAATYFLGHAEMPLALFPVSFQEKLDMRGASFPLFLAIHLLVNVLMAAVVEEFFFRGLLFPALAVRRTLVWSAVLCSITFTFVHLGNFFDFNAFVLSFVLLIVYAKGGSLYTCIAAHAGYNLLTFLAWLPMEVPAIPRAVLWTPAVCLLVWLWYRHRNYLRSWWIKPECRGGSAGKEAALL
jgi:membrane protease YdiL (CAAX protease family)